MDLISYTSKCFLFRNKDTMPDSHVSIVPIFCRLHFFIQSCSTTIRSIKRHLYHLYSHWSLGEPPTAPSFAPVSIEHAAKKARNFHVQVWLRRNSYTLAKQQDLPFDKALDDVIRARKNKAAAVLLVLHLSKCPSVS